MKVPVNVTDLNPLTQEFHAICVDKDAVPTWQSTLVQPK